MAVQPSGTSDAVDFLQVVQTVLDDILGARTPQRISGASCPPEAQALADSVNRLVRHMEELAVFVLPLARGELDTPQPSPDNLMAAPFIELHAHLSKLSRQAGRIAQGDYTQRVDFMGDFSDAFNSMVELLAERENALVEEIARRKEAEVALARERDLLAAGPVVTFRWDTSDEGAVLYVSPNVTAYGFSADDLLSRRITYAQLVHPDDFAWLVDDGNAKARSGLDAWTHEYRLVDADGRTHWVRDYTHAERDDDGTVLCYEGYILDVTAQKVAEEALREREKALRMLSLTDELTGLYNRRGLFALGEHMMRSAKRHKTGLGVVLVDLDDLNRINDRYGHKHGDEALRETAGILKACIRESDVLARAGGDEFVVLVEDIPSATEGLAERVRRRMAASNSASTRPFRLGAGLGAVFWPAHEEATLQELIDRADRRRRESASAPRAG